MKNWDANTLLEGKFGICGCGQPATAVKWIQRALELIKQREDEGFSGEANARMDDHWPEEESPLFWLIWYYLDSTGLIEHGGGVTGSFLLPDGHDFLEWLQARPRCEDCGEAMMWQGEQVEPGRADMWECDGLGPFHDRRELVVPLPEKAESPQP